MNNTSLPLNLLLLRHLVFADFSWFLVPMTVSGIVFLSIDCGSSSVKPRTDNNPIVWVGDRPYIKTGEIHKVNAPDIPVFDSNAMRTLRAFPTRNKNCYSIDIDSKGENSPEVGRVLTRANFYYANYDNKSSPPTFNLPPTLSLTLGTKPRIPPPSNGKSYNALAQPITILLIMLSGLFL